LVAETFAEGKKYVGEERYFAESWVGEKKFVAEKNFVEERNFGRKMCGEGESRVEKSCVEEKEAVASEFGVNM
jgi:hypothetical protein